MREALAAYAPRRPDLAEVDGGLTRGGVGGAGRAVFSLVIFESGPKPGRLAEKSGMPRGDFFFMGSSHGRLLFDALKVL
jgi:hypothetical protein